MLKNSFANVASTALIIGCCVFSPNSTSDQIMSEYKFNVVCLDNGYGTDSLIPKECSINKQNNKYFNKDKFNSELEAELLFGKMRGATLEEQAGIQDYIDSISVPTGRNFWD